MKVYIPGGAGYIGQVLVRHLLANGFRIQVLDNLMYGQALAADIFEHPAFSFATGDFCDLSIQQSYIREADIIIPLAALVGAPICDRYPELAERTNWQAPIELFKRLSSDQMILMPTTNSAYGHGDAKNHCDETSPLKPISTYAKMKVWVEQELMAKSNAISFRLATVFGVSPRMRLDLLVNNFTYRAFTSGKLTLFEGHFMRNYVHVQDVARAFLHGISNFQSMRGEIYNVGLSSANLSKKDLALKIQRQLPTLVIEDSPLGKDPDQRNYIVSNEKIENTGFRPRVSLDEGISEVLEYLKLNSGAMFDTAHNDLKTSSAGQLTVDRA